MAMSDIQSRADNTKRPLNVLILDNELNMGGVEKKLFDFVSRLNPSDVRVVMCCLKDGGFFRDHFVKLGVPFYEGLMTNKFDAWAYLKLLGILKREKIDVLYTFVNPNTLFFANWARRQGKVPRALVSFHSSAGDDGGPLLKPYMRRLLKPFDCFIAIANIHKRYLVADEGVDESRIEVIFNGVDTEKYRPGPASETLRDTLGIKPGEKVVTTIASLKPEKSLDVMMRAAGGVAKHHDNVRFLFVGRGPARDHLQALADDLGIGNRVVFAGLREDVDEILRLTDVLTLSSRPGPETLPNVVLEAMATGLPVVTTEVGSVRELVIDGENGFVVPVGDHEALASRIRDLVADTDLAQKMGAAGRAIAETRFPIHLMFDQRVELFRRLIETEAPLAAAKTTSPSAG